MSKRKERERKREGKGREGRLLTGERCEWRPVMMPVKCQPVSLGREGEADGGHGKKKNNKRAILAQNMQPAQNA